MRTTYDELYDHVVSEAEDLDHLCQVVIDDLDPLLGEADDREKAYQSLMRDYLGRQLYGRAWVLHCLHKLEENEYA